MFLLNDEIKFPNVKFADENGLLAIGGDLSTERLKLAYKSGIFRGIRRVNLYYGIAQILVWYFILKHLKSQKVCVK